MSGEATDDPFRPRPRIARTPVHGDDAAAPSTPDSIGGPHAAVLSDEEARVARAVKRVAQARRDLADAMKEQTSAMRALPAKQPLVAPGFLPETVSTPTKGDDAGAATPVTTPVLDWRGATPPAEAVARDGSAELDSPADTPFVQPWAPARRLDVVSLTAPPAAVDDAAAAERADGDAPAAAASSGGEAKPASLLFGFELFFCYGCTGEAT